MFQKQQEIRTLSKRFKTNNQRIKEIFTNCQLMATSRQSTKGMKWDSVSVKKALQLR